MKYTQEPSNKDCCLCQEIRDGKFPEQYSSLYGTINRICIETKNFIVVPSIAPLSEGHLLFIPKEHITCMLFINSDFHEEFKKLFEKTYNILKKTYGSLYFFEHGVINVSDQACGINHAHLHVIPLDYNQSKVINDQIKNNFQNNSKISLNEIGTIEKPESAYLMYGTDPNSINFSLSNHIPSQIMRKTIANLINNQNWDWHNLGGAKEFTSTVSLFQ